MSVKFWQERLAAHGHTGWFDPSIYAFDQRCRLGAFRRWLEEERLLGGLALDFGAGSGDFSRLLIDRGWRVVGYDKYVSPWFQHQKLQTTDSVEVVAASAPYDLIVSVTVLGHIMDDAEFRRQLVELRNWLRPGGRFFFLEYASDLEKQSASSYEALRTLETWESAIAAAKLRLEAIEPFFHPVEAPVPAWASYSASAIARGHGRLRRLRVPLALTRPLLARAAKKALRTHPYSAPASSPMKILRGSTR
jgi:SAM-dependent methyltransferase